MDDFTCIMTVLVSDKIYHGMNIQVWAIKPHAACMMQDLNISSPFHEDQQPFDVRTLCKILLEGFLGWKGLL